MRLGGRAVDVLIEASGAVVSKDALLSRVRRGRIVDQNRQGEARACAERAAAALRAGRRPSALID